MGTVTLNMSNEVETMFRRMAKERFGKGKGRLKKAVEAAITMWTKAADSDEAAKRVIEMMDQGIPMGYKHYKVRDELHDRSL